MSNPIEAVSGRTAFGDIGPMPAESAIHARAQRHRRRSRLLLSGSGGVLAVVMFAAVLAVRQAPENPQVTTNGLASATTPVENLVGGTGQNAVGATVDSGRAPAATGEQPVPVSERATAVPPVTIPGQSPPPPTQPVFTPPPSGTRLYFLSAGDLVSTRLDGTDRVVVLKGYFGVPIDVWPDGSKLLMGTTQGGGSSIVILDLRTGNRTTVVHREKNDMAGVDLSPDGTRIAYSAANNRVQTFVTGYTSPDDVHIVNVDGSGDRVLVHGSRPLWKPDGSRLLVQGCEDSSGRPCTIKPDGSDKQVLQGFPYAGPVAWSPDGTWIAGQGSDGRLSIAHLDGSQLRTVGKSVGSGQPAWTPDGTRIIYERLPEGMDLHTGQCGSGCDGTYGLSSAALNGSGDVQLTTAQNDGFPVIG